MDDISTEDRAVATGQIFTWAVLADDEGTLRAKIDFTGIDKKRFQDFAARGVVVAVAVIYESHLAETEADQDPETEG